jgi:Protein of unknown function with PCYCGC motif
MSSAFSSGVRLAICWRKPIMGGTVPEPPVRVGHRLPSGAWSFSRVWMMIRVTESSHMPTRRTLLVSVSVLALTTALAGTACAAPTARTPTSATPASGEMMAFKDAPLPDYVRTPMAMQAYRAALASPAAMQAAKCYCGCHKLADPHRTLYDCFVTPRGTFADHGATCGTCQT